MAEDIDSFLFDVEAHSPTNMNEQIGYALWGAVATTTKAFGKVEVKINPALCRIFICVELRWWAKFKRLKLFREFWLRRADARAKQYLPTGWRVLVYYASRNNADNSANQGRTNEGSTNDAVGSNRPSRRGNKTPKRKASNNARKTNTARRGK